MMKVLNSFLLTLILVFLLQSKCARTTSPPSIPIQRNLGHLSLNIKTIADFITPYGMAAYEGTPYWGYYESADGFKNEVAILIRSVNGAIGSINKIFLSIQAGTGADLRNGMYEDRGLHRVAIFVALRGNYIDPNDFARTNFEYECGLGTRLIDCLNNHQSFRISTPKATASDVADVIKIFREGMPITLNGTVRQVSELLPSNLELTSINTLVASFAGVIFGHLLEDVYAPPLNDVYIDQATSPIELPTSEGPVLGYRRFEYLFASCEKDSKCNIKYPRLRTVITTWLSNHHEIPSMIDGGPRASGFVFDAVEGMLSSTRGANVAGAISYLGEISKKYTNNDTDFVTRVVYSLTPGGTVLRTGSITEAGLGGIGRFSDYGVPAFNSTQIQDFAMRFSSLAGRESPPMYALHGFTNRIAMLCNFGVNRAENPDSTDTFNRVLSNPMYSPFKYGFLVFYRAFLDFCPRIQNITGINNVPKPRNVNANRVLLYYGGLDVKHSYEDGDELMKYFNSSTKIKYIQDYNLSQRTGPMQALNCYDPIVSTFWRTNNFPTCERNNLLTVSSLSEAGSLFDE